jgi:hypothetical protein
LTKLFGNGVPGFGSIVGFAVFVTAALVAVPFVVAALVAAEFAGGSAIGGDAAAESVGVFGIAVVAARRRRAGFDSSAWAAVSCAATAFATFVASRCSQLLTVVCGTP